VEVLVKNDKSFGTRLLGSLGTYLKRGTARSDHRSLLQPPRASGARKPLKTSQNLSISFQLIMVCKNCGVVPASLRTEEDRSFPSAQTLQTTLGEPWATKERPPVRITALPGLLGSWALGAQTRRFQNGGTAKSSQDNNGKSFGTRLLGSLGTYLKRGTARSDHLSLFQAPRASPL
jgi:hypothetical protein